MIGFKYALAFTIIITIGINSCIILESNERIEKELKEAIVTHCNK